jgi:hypothetical protein
MGISKYVYIGHFLECKNEIIVENVYGKLCCNKNYDITDLYCSICGKKLIEKIIDTNRVEKVEWVDVSDKIDDAFWRICEEQVEGEIPEDITIWVCNEGTSFENDYINYITVGDIEKSHRELTTKYAKELESIRKIYGEKNVSIKFGVIEYWS